MGVNFYSQLGYLENVFNNDFTEKVQLYYHEILLKI